MASPVLPEVPVALALELVESPVVAFPLELALASPDCARMASPESALTSVSSEASPDPARALGLEVEPPVVALALTSALERASPESPPSPEPPLLALGLEVTAPELPVLPTVPELPPLAVPPPVVAATELLLPEVP